MPGNANMRMMPVGARPGEEIPRRRHGHGHDGVRVDEEGYSPGGDRRRDYRAVAAGVLRLADEDSTSLTTREKQRVAQVGQLRDVIRALEWRMAAAQGSGGGRVGWGGEQNVRGDEDGDDEEDAHVYDSGLVPRASPSQAAMLVEKARARLESISDNITERVVVRAERVERRYEAVVEKKLETKVAVAHAALRRQKQDAAVMGELWNARIQRELRPLQAKTNEFKCENQGRWMSKLTCFVYCCPYATSNLMRRLHP